MFTHQHTSNDAGRACMTPAAAAVAAPVCAAAAAALTSCIMLMHWHWRIRHWRIRHETACVNWPRMSVLAGTTRNCKLGKEMKSARAHAVS